MVDLTEEEEASCQDRAVHVAVNAKGGVCGISKSESTPVPPGKLLVRADIATTIALACRRNLFPHLSLNIHKIEEVLHLMKR